MRIVQVFNRAGDGMAEISAELISCKYLHGGVLIKTKEDSKAIFEHFFPYATLDMLRFFDEKEGK